MEDNQKKSPIDYKFSYEIKKCKDGNPTGYFEMVIVASCQDVKLFEFHQVAFFSKAFPHLKEKAELINDICGEDFGIFGDGLIYGNIDLQMKLRLSPNDVTRYMETLRSAVNELKKVKSQQFQQLEKQ